MFNGPRNAQRIASVNTVLVLNHTVAVASRQKNGVCSSFQGDNQVVALSALSTRRLR